MTRSAIGLAATALLCLFAPGCTGKETEGAPEGGTVPIGGELQICRDCPDFVRVPDAPQGIRPIRFVAKYELTWNNYLAAYDAGRCNIPNPNTGIRYKKGPNDLLADVESLRIDWPANQLGPNEVKCYIAWLQEKTPYLVALPDVEEWEWFARAGRTNAKFPWGNEPDANKEALCGNTNIEKLRLPPATMALASRAHMQGVAPGQFPPNDWGLYDVMGSLYELTSVVISGKDWYVQHPDSRWASYTKNRDHAVLKGGDNAFCDWSKEGISGQATAVIWDGRYTTSVAIRLVFVERGGE